MLDPFNPRSVAFQVERIVEHLTMLPSLRRDGIDEMPLRKVRILSAEIAGSEAADLTMERMGEIDMRLVELSRSISERYFLQGALTSRAERYMGLA